MTACLSGQIRSLFYLQGIETPARMVYQGKSHQSLFYLQGIETATMNSALSAVLKSLFYLQGIETTFVGLFVNLHLSLYSTYKELKRRQERWKHTQRKSLFYLQGIETRKRTAVQRSTRRVFILPTRN